MTLNNAKDIHLVFHAVHKQLRLHGGAGDFHWSAEARGEGEFADQKRKNGNTPLGRYWCGEPEPIGALDRDGKKYGPWFVPLQPEDGVATGRSGLGIHGGGSDLPSPRADFQGWETTRGCIRLQNFDLERLAKALDFTTRTGGAALLTVDWTLGPWRPGTLNYISALPRVTTQQVKAAPGKKTPGR